MQAAAPTHPLSTFDGSRPGARCSYGRAKCKRPSAAARLLHAAGCFHTHENLFTLSDAHSWQVWCEWMASARDIWLTNYTRGYTPLMKQDQWDYFALVAGLGLRRDGASIVRFCPCRCRSTQSEVSARLQTIFGAAGRTSGTSARCGSFVPADDEREVAWRAAARGHGLILSATKKPQKGEMTSCARQPLEFAGHV